MAAVLWCKDEPDMACGVQLVDEVMPLVRGAPNLGGATRNDLAARQAATRARGGPPRRQLPASSLSQVCWSAHYCPPAVQSAAQGSFVPCHEICLQECHKQCMVGVSC